MDKVDMLLTEGTSSFCPLTAQEARQKNPLALAYIGDTVYDLFVRRMIVKSSGAGVNALHVRSCALVNAHAQALAARRLEGLFTEEEQGVYKRGRNAKSGVPKNMSVSDYRAATGLEAVVGYLYLSGERERLEQIFEVILNGEK